MSMKEDGGPAFPLAANEYAGHGPQAGMTLRDYFAAKALAALIGFPEKSDVNRGENGVHRLAKWAYEYADAMLLERDK